MSAPWPALFGALALTTLLWGCSHRQEQPYGPSATPYRGASKKEAKVRVGPCDLRCDEQLRACRGKGQLNCESIQALCIQRCADRRRNRKVVAEGASTCGFLACMNIPWGCPVPRI